MPFLPAVLDRAKNDGAGGVAGGCPIQTVTHSAFNFQDGQVTLQAGFAEMEIAAASYTLPASAFPIVLNTTEMIFAQNHFNPTVTKWSVMIWDGTPSNGTLVDVFSSDDKMLPHLRLPVGNPPAQAANILFQVDPGDPEQIIINNTSGTNTFTIGYRIDDHNQQTGNPCLQGPPQSQNAFPTTDNTSVPAGLAQPAQNWLFGLNCGSFGCPPNGGWSTFASLPTLCRPNGDWNIRATYRSINCGPQIGACCLPNGSCIDMVSQQQCMQQGGTYQGSGTFCSGVTCPQPVVACCFAGGGCINLTAANCIAAGGSPGAFGSSCGQTGVCVTTGACCLPTGNCIDGVTLQQCQAQNGIYQGNNSTCQGVQCPPAVGACCFQNGFCLVLTQTECENGINTVFRGAMTTCEDKNGNGIADICEANPADLNGDGVVGSADLGIMLGSWGNPGCGGAVPCAADLNGDGQVGSADLGILLGSWG